MHEMQWLYGLGSLKKLLMRYHCGFHHDGSTVRWQQLVFMVQNKCYCASVRSFLSSRNGSSLMSRQCWRRLRSKSQGNIVVLALAKLHLTTDDMNQLANRRAHSLLRS
jgi:hypothetical protein